MSEVLQANIFFLITGIAVIVFSALLCVALFHGIKVLKALRRVMDRIEEGTEIIAEDMQNVRTYFTADGLLRRLISKLIGSDSSVSKTKKTERKRNELKINEE